MGVADEDQLASGLLYLVGQGGQLACAHHGGFVDHHDHAIREVPLDVHLALEGGKARREDPGRLLQSDRGPGGEGRSADREPRDSGQLGEHSHDGGLAGAGRAYTDVDVDSGCGESTDHLTLLCGQLGPTSERTLDEPVGYLPGDRVSVECPAEDPLFCGENLTSGVPIVVCDSG